MPTYLSTLFSYQAQATLVRSGITIERITMAGIAVDAGVAGTMGGYNLLNFQEDDFLALGFQLRGFQQVVLHNRRSQIELFRSIFGTSPMILSLL